MKTVIFGLVAFAAGCGGTTTPLPVADAGLEARLLEIARDYERFGRVDDEARWAPALCRGPEPSRARFSVAEAPSPHGSKLYFVFAKDRQAYLFGAGKSQPADQVVVKESWIPAVAAPGEEPKPKSMEASHPWFPAGYYVPYARRDGRLYRASEKAGLFVMVKSGGPETDAGWAYGTVSPDGKVTSSGRLASCMSCHVEATPDRVFGLTSTKP
jgi:hypothetical protein